MLITMKNNIFKTIWITIGLMLICLLNNAIASGGGGDVLGIDIRIIIVQAMGFIVVFFILKKFLFEPLKKVMDERRNHIQGTLDKIETDRSSMEHLKHDYENRLQNVENEARQKIQEAIKKAEGIGEEIKQKKQAEAEQYLEKAQMELKREYEQSLLKLRSDITDLTLAASSKLIQKELTTDKHRELIEKFISEMELK